MSLQLFKNKVHTKKFNKQFKSRFEEAPLSDVESSNNNSFLICLKTVH